jgi:hypothetical protein
MDAEEADKPGSNPISAVEGTWPLDEWPLDVQRVDENGIDLSLVELTLALSLEERVEQNYRDRLFAEELRRAGERHYGSAFPDLEEVDRV